MVSLVFITQAKLQNPSGGETLFFVDFRGSSRRNIGILRQRNPGTSQGSSRAGIFSFWHVSFGSPHPTSWLPFCLATELQDVLLFWKITPLWCHTIIRYFTILLNIDDHIQVLVPPSGRGGDGSAFQIRCLSISKKKYQI